VASKLVYFVQLRFHSAGDWVTVASATSRASAAAYAGAAFTRARDDVGALAEQVRIVSEQDLRQRHGPDAVTQAYASVAGHAGQPEEAAPGGGEG
jgi:hypothetical protein